MSSSIPRIAGGPVYDPDGAERRLDNAGWIKGADGIRSRNGSRLALTLGSGYPTPQVQRPIPEVIQTQLRGLGADAKILEVDKGLSEAADDGGRLRMHLWLEAYGQPDADPGGILSFFLQSATDWIAVYDNFVSAELCDRFVARLDTYASTMGFKWDHDWQRRHSLSATADDTDDLRAIMNRALRRYQSETGCGSLSFVRAMENLKLALRLKLERGALSDEQAQAVAAALDAAAQAIDRT